MTIRARLRQILTSIVLLRGTVHDPTTRRMGGVAGHAGVFSTAGDVALFAQALLDRLAGRKSNFPLQASDVEADDAARTAIDRGCNGDYLCGRWKDHYGRRCARVWVGYQHCVFSAAGRGLSDRQLRTYRVSPGHRCGWIRRAIRLLLFWRTRFIRAGRRLFRRCGGRWPLRLRSASALREARTACSITISADTLTGIDVLEATHFELHLPKRRASRRPSAAWAC